MKTKIINAAKAAASHAKPIAGTMLKAAGVAIVGIAAEMLQAKLKGKEAGSDKPNDSEKK